MMQRRPKSAVVSSASQFLRISRRTLLKGGLATPLLASAGLADGDKPYAEVDLSFIWNEDQTKLSVIPIFQEVDGDGNPIGVARKGDYVWQLALESFGGDARFILQRRKSQGGDSDGYTLRVINVSVGRIGSRRFDLEFRKFNEPVSGNITGPKQARYRVAAISRFWSSQTSTTGVTPFTMSLRDPNTDLEVSPNDLRASMILLSELADAQSTPRPGAEMPDPSRARLSQIITVGQVRNTFRLLFNGAIGFRNINAKALVVVHFNSDASWTVKLPAKSSASLAMNALHPNITFREFRFSWGRPENAAGKPDTPWNDLQLMGESFELSLQQLDLGGRNGPRPLIRLPENGPRPTLFLRAAFAEAPPESGEADSQSRYLTEVGLVLPDAGLSLQGAETEALGELRGLRLRLLARVSAPAVFMSGEATELAGTLSIDGHANVVTAKVDDAAQNDATNTLAPASLEQNVASPLGGLTLAVLAESETPEAEYKESGANAQQDKPKETPQDIAFAARTPRPVLITQSWADGQRITPVTDWVEVHARLTRAELALKGAELSRLEFKPTDLLIHYAPEGLAEEPLTSVLRLGNVGDQPRARLDLTRATLSAGRGGDLLSLKFRFTDISLVCRRSSTELVALSPRCLSYREAERVVNGRSGTPVPPLPDVRPILVVEFPPQHLFETALAIPNDPDLPDVTLDDQEVDVELASGAVVDATEDFAKEGWVRLDLNQRARVSEVLGQMTSKWSRFSFRSEIRQRKIDKEKQGNEDNKTSDKGDTKPKVTSTEFQTFSADAVKKLRSLTPRVPSDQQQYIGPYALDPDAMIALRNLAQTRVKDKLTTQIKAMAEEVHRQADSIISNAIAISESTGSDSQSSLMAKASENLSNALMLEGFLESAVPPYAEFRSWYREEAIKSYAKKGADAPPSLDATEIEVFWQALPGTSQAARPAWSNTLDWSRITDRIAKGWSTYSDDLAKPDLPGGLTEGRLSGPTRLAFRIRCRDGLVAGRLKVPAIDHDPDLTGRPADAATLPDRPGLRRERFDFSLDALTSFGDMELSVTRRAERVFAPDGAGRVDPSSRRRIHLNAGAMLTHLGFRSGEFLTSSERLADIQASLVEPSPNETAIEIPARLILSPHQEAVFLTRRKVPDDVYDIRPGEKPAKRLPQGEVPLWSAELRIGGDDPGLRAVYSPDLAPDFVWRRLHRASGIRKSREDATLLTLPGGAAPLRGPWAPWTIGREETGLAIPAARDVALATGDNALEGLAGEHLTDEGFCEALKEAYDEESRRTRFSALIDYLCGRQTKDPPDARFFRAPMDARARHELVLLSSAWGLPVVGRRTESGVLDGNSGQVQPDRIDQVIDVQAGSALYLPKTLDVRELSLTALGGTFRHDTIFEPPAAARHLSGEPLFDALSIEKWRQWTVLGRDILCEVVYKGFLFPLGHRASLVQLTERTFFQDTAAAKVRVGGIDVYPIRAYLNQRLFIRVGKPEKDFAAVGQPLQGRMWPPRMVKIVTEVTSDLTDPNADFPKGKSQVHAGGRIELPETTGLAFWPRTARTSLANLRFEVEFDKTRSEVPLIFVDNVLANDRVGMEALVAYYNGANSDFSADPALRMAALRGTKLRYADERESGSASVETESWLLAASGQQGAPPDPLTDPTTVKLDNSDFTFGPILQGADQPPFYPVVASANIYLRQSEKLTGQSFGPVPARFDGVYLKDGLPAIKEDTPKDRGHEMYLAVQLTVPLDLDDGGDRAGGIVRPNAVPVGLSRARGVLTWSKDDLPSLSGRLDVWDAISQRFLTKEPPQADGSAKPGQTSPALSAADVAAKAFGETKLLGTIKMSKLIAALKELQNPRSLGDAVPELTEHIRWGAEALRLDEIVVVMRDAVILPMAEAVAEAQALWRDAAQTVAQNQAKNFGGTVKPITLEELFPELGAGLTGLDAALKASLKLEDPIIFSLSLGAVYEAGRRLIDAVVRTLANPVERFELAFKSRISEIKSLLDEALRDLPGQLAGQLKELIGDAKAKERLLTWLDKAVAEANLRPIRFFAPSDSWILDETINNTVGPALDSLVWSSEEFGFLVRELAAFTFDQVVGGEPLSDTPEKQFRKFLSQTITDPKVTDPNDPNQKTTMGDWLLRQSKGKLEEARRKIESATDEKIVEIREEIDGFIRALEAAREALIEDLIDRYVDWLLEEFGKELLYIQAAAQTFADIKGDLEAGNVLTATQSAISFVELFTGPLGLDLVAECNRIAKPIAALLSPISTAVTSLSVRTLLETIPKIAQDGTLNIRKEPNDEVNLLYQLGQFHDRIANTLTRLRGLQEKAQSTSILPLLTLANLAQAIAAIEDARVATETLIVTLASDALTARALGDRISAFAKAIQDDGGGSFCDAGNPKGLKLYRSIDRDLKTFLRNRRQIAKAVMDAVDKIARSIGQLAGNETVQYAALLTGLIEGLETAGIDVSELKQLAEDAKKYLEEQDRKISVAAIHALHWAFDGLRAALAGLKELQSGLLTTYATNIKPYVDIVGLTENLGAFDPYITSLQQAAVAIKALKDRTHADPDDADTDDPALSEVAEVLRSIETNHNFNLVSISTKPGALTLAKLAEIDRKIDEEFIKLEKLAAKIALRSLELADKAFDGIVKAILEFKAPLSGDKPLLSTIYKNIRDARDTVVADLKNQTSGLISVKAFEVWTENDPVKLDSVRKRAADYLTISKPDNDGPEDAIWADAGILEKFRSQSGIFGKPELKNYLGQFASEWANGGAPPQRLVEQILDLAQSLVRGDILQLIDLNRVRDQIEERLKSLLPIEVTLKSGFDVTLEDEAVKDATKGLLQPQGNPQLTFGSEVKISPFNDQLVTFAARGDLGRFDIKLVGDFIDALTLRFAGARFRAGTGQETRFDVDYLGHEVGPALAFVEKLSEILNPGAGSGPYLRPTFNPIGIQAGYRLDVGAFSLGAVAFDNIKLDCSVILPFDSSDARFRASLSTRESPFTISYLPWGGSGFFAIEANPDGIVSMELQFEFGGSAIFAFGPLTGKGRAMAGLYVRTFTTSGRRSTEIQATFFVGGSAKIWIFGFGASLLVRLGQVEGAMTGLAVFTYSFSIGIKDFEFSVQIRKREEKGYSGDSSNGSVQKAELRGLRRFAKLGPLSTDASETIGPDDPRIDTLTECQGKNWATYSRYFQPFKGEECF